MENILNAPSMTPDEKNTLYSNEYHMKPHISE